MYAPVTWVTGEFGARENPLVGALGVPEPFHDAIAIIKSPVDTVGRVIVIVLPDPAVDVLCHVAANVGMVVGPEGGGGTATCDGTMITLSSL